MTEQLITFETAKLAKKAKVDIESYKFYTYRGDLCIDHICANQNKYDGSYGAYTQYLLQKWFRYIHNIHILLFPQTCDNEGNVTYACYIRLVTKDHGIKFINKYNSFYIKRLSYD